MLLSSMATATHSAAAVPGAVDHAPRGPDASPSLANHHRASSNGSVTPGMDGVVHPGLRMDMRPGNGAQRDGRVRNPIPSKLKGKTDEKKGNFNVMHMDISHSAESQARYDAAKRNSEKTALQAKMAETDHYVSHHRRANYARSRPDMDAVTSAPTTPLPPRVQPLNAEQTKAEQARLLTLLRTLPHANVVDQICKALAFFGGIPDAPPPQDGKFPESGESNGSGSLFVGWVSEIFPDLERPRRPAAAITLSAPPKRPRGRPKGSKATKARRDKGIKKGSKAGDTALTDEAVDQPNGDDDEWMDVDGSTMDVVGPRESVEDRVLNLLETPPATQTVPIANKTTPATAVSAGFTSINPAIVESVSASKKRGRPKGSKNRAKEGGAQEPAQHDPQSSIVDSTATGSNQAALMPATPTANATVKKAAARQSKGGKKTKTAADSAQTAVPVNQSQAPPQTSTTYIPPPTLPIAATRPTMTASPQSSAVNGNTSKNKRTQLPTQGQPTADLQYAQPMSTHPSQPMQTMQPSQPLQPAQSPQLTQAKESTVVGVKRKRQNNKAITKNASINGQTTTSTGPGNGSIQSTLPVASETNMNNATQSHLGLADTTTGTGNNAAPPAKRARKSNTAASKRQSTATVPKDGDPSTTVSVDTRLPQPSVPSGTVPQTQQSAGGLEAHYDRYSATQKTTESSAYDDQQQIQPAPQTNVSSGHAASSTPSEGLLAHLDRFTALQNRSNQQGGGTRQPTRQHQQQPLTQSLSPIPSQVSKTPQMPNLPPQQHTRSASNAPNYYAQSQSPAYTIQQGSYSVNQRQAQNPSTSSPGTALASQVAHSPQYGSQSNNSPLLNTENTFRGSPSLGYAPRRTPSASSMDNNYRTNSVANQSSHFANSRQAPSTSHSGMTSNFPSTSDNSLFDIQSFDYGNPSTMDLNNTSSYALSSGNVQRANTSSSSASAYASAAINATYDQSGINKNTINNYRGQARWS